MAQPKSTIPTQRPALRLVSTKRMSREDWLKIRKQGIGASDAAAAVGISPYQSPLELWMIKTGRDALLPTPDPDDIQSPLYWGTLLEPKVAEAYAKITGTPSSVMTMYRSWSARPRASTAPSSGRTGFPSTSSARCSTSWPSPASRRQTWPC
jgi:hypothetical protein